MRVPPRYAHLATAVVAVAALLPMVPAASAAAGQDGLTLQQAFADAAERYQVPESVLLGVSYLESRWDTHQGLPSVTGGYGPMHLTDAATALADFPQTGDGGDDARGDSARPLVTAVTAAAPDTSDLPASLTTLDRAAGLTGLSAQSLREDPAANVAGGAALLAAAQKSLDQPLGPSSDPADWYGAVAAYSGADDTATAAAFADDVFGVVRGGEARTTDTGQRIALAAAPDVAPDTGQLPGLALKAAADDSETECPSDVACEWLPAPYQELSGGDYGNHDVADRPNDEKIDYIVIHDTEGSWDTALKLVQDPTYLAWHYTVRSADGHIAQHLKTKDVGWHAGNWYVNAKSIGVEHEGILTDPGTWYTEAMYRSSARLVRYLADKYGIPLDRQHILGHDNVPGPVTSYISGMHTDPGPYWDWAHYFELMGAPLRATASTRAAAWSPSGRTTRPTSRSTPAASRPATPARHAAPRPSGSTPSRARTPRSSRTSGCTARPAPRRPVSTTPAPGPPPASSTRSPGAKATGPRSGTSARRPGSTTPRRSRPPSTPRGW